MKRETSIKVAMFCLLVALGVAGRWLGARDEWLGLAPNFTPIAAIGLFAGFYFARRAVALLVPLTAMVISNLCLDSYGSWLMLVTVYSAFLVAPLLGRGLRTRPSGLKIAISVVLPAAFFFLATNFAEWFVDGQHIHTMYSRDWSGLATCYAAGLPFFRWMLEGDLFFAGMLFGTYALAVYGQPGRLVRQTVPLERSRTPRK